MPICSTCRTTPEEVVRRVIEVVSDGAFAHEMDHGVVIKVTR